MLKEKWLLLQLSNSDYAFEHLQRKLALLIVIGVEY
jgi:hypothetical protein